MCLAHQLRNLQAVVDRYPSSFWSRAKQAMFRSAIHAYDQSNYLSPPEFQAQVQRIDRICDRWLKRKWEQPEAKQLLKWVHKYRNFLFVFLHRTDVSPTKNISERNLTPPVVHCKVMGYFHFGRGARAYAALPSLNATAGLKAISSLDAIQNFSALLQCPFLQGCE